MIQSHRTMLQDRVRTHAFKEAIFRHVRAGATVLDIGTGTGILALLAFQAGAERVYAIESTPFIDVAKKIAAQNGYQDRVRFIRGDSRDIRLPQKANILVSETMGSLGIDENILNISLKSTAGGYQSNFAPLTPRW